jgi:LmbE family N-acetylglucosaminyl deacetylase
VVIFANNVMAVGAHPDDIELGCAGTILKHVAKGDNVYVMVMTNGENGSHAIVTKECLLSLNCLGVKSENIIFGSFPDASLNHSIKEVDFIEKRINEFNISKVYTHYHDDRHQDHRNCSLAVSSAARKIPELLMFQGPSTNTGFQSRYYVELTKDDFEKKMQAIRCYETQISKGIIKLNIVESLARLHGAMHNVNFAEAFAVNKLLRRGQDV